MNVKRLAILGLLAVSLLLVGTGCSSRLLTRAEPTSPPARTPRPTFTPLPEVTDTPMPTDTPQQPTEAPTKPPAPTKKAVATSKPKPTQPSAPPAVPTNTPVPPKPVYQYSYIKQTCEDSGGVFIKIVVFSDYRDPDSQQAGVSVRASWAPDNAALGDADGVTDGFGEWHYTLQTNLPAKVGTYYAWVIDKNTKKRISDISAPININNLGPDDPNSCKLAKVFFAAGK